MAHFIGYLKGSRGEASRLGTKLSGVDVSARGWDIGGSVSVYHKDGIDYVEFYVDGGSNGGRTTKSIARFKLNGKGEIEPA